MKLFATFLMVAGAGIATAQNQGGDKKQPLDKEFLVKAAGCVGAELEIIKLGEKQAESEAVKKFAMSMHKNHQSWSDRISGLMKTHKVDSPGMVMNKETQEQIKKLGAMQGKEFDQAFLKLLVEEHKNALPVIENQAKNGQLADIREAAQEMNSELRRHIARAEELIKTGK